MYEQSFIKTNACVHNLVIEQKVSIHPSHRPNVFLQTKAIFTYKLQTTSTESGLGIVWVAYSFYIAPGTVRVRCILRNFGWGVESWWSHGMRWQQRRLAVHWPITAFTLKTMLHGFKYMQNEWKEEKNIQRGREENEAAVIRACRSLQREKAAPFCVCLHAHSFTFASLDNDLLSSHMGSIVHYEDLVLRCQQGKTWAKRFRHLCSQCESLKRNFKVTVCLNKA